MIITQEEVRENIQTGLVRAGFTHGIEWKVRDKHYKMLSSRKFNGIIGILPWDSILDQFAIGEQIMRDNYVRFTISAINKLQYQTVIELRE
jgi:hypothetical protein